MSGARKDLPPPATGDVLSRRFSIDSPPAQAPAPPAPAQSSPARTETATPPPRRDVDRTPATSADPARIAYTWRLTAEQADQLDTLVLRLRRQLGRGRLDKAAVLLALVQLTDEQDDIRAAVLGRLKATG